MSVGDILLAIVPGLARLIDVIISDRYDREAELQAILSIRRAVADLKVRNALKIGDSK